MDVQSGRRLAIGTKRPLGHHLTLLGINRRLGIQHYFAQTRFVRRLQIGLTARHAHDCEFRAKRAEAHGAFEYCSCHGGYRRFCVKLDSRSQQSCDAHGWSRSTRSRRYSERIGSNSLNLRFCVRGSSRRRSITAGNFVKCGLRSAS